MTVGSIVRSAQPNVPSVLKDPFALTHVEGVNVFFSKGIISKRWGARGTIEFENGKTSGEQRFEGETIEDVLAQMGAFLKTLEASR